MNKTIICFLFLILFFQYKCSACTEKTGTGLTKDDCKDLETDGNTICILGNEACVEKSCLTINSEGEESDNFDDNTCSQFHSTVTGEKNACIASLEGKCVETNVCNEVKAGASDELCKKLSTTNSEKMACIKDGNGCKETTQCSDVKTLATDDLCVKLTPSHPETQVCVNNNGKCEESSNCLDLKSNADNDLCMKLVTNSDSSLCINNGGICKEITNCDELNYSASNERCLKLETTSPTSVCIKDTDNSCKETSNCEDVNSDASQSICEKLSTEGKQCVFNSNKCEVKSTTTTSGEGGTNTSGEGGTNTNTEGGTNTNTEGGTNTNTQGGTNTNTEGGTNKNTEGGTKTNDASKSDTPIDTSKANSQGENGNGVNNIKLSFGILSLLVLL